MKTTLTAIFALASLVACGDGDDGASRSERLTQAAYEQACASAESFLLDQYGGSYYVQALCTAAAVESTSDAASCGDELQACLDDPPAAIQAGVDAILTQAGCDALAIDPSACSSTVGRLKDCLDALEGAVANVEYTLTCAAAGQTLESWDIVEFPAECQLLESDC